MSIETAMAALNTPAPVQQQAISQNEVAAATVEAETKSINDAKIVEPASDKSGVEAKVEAPKTEETKKDEPFSAKFSALTKREKTLQKQAQENKVKEAGFAEREAKIAAREAKIAASEKLWETNVFDAIKERTGMDYNALTLAYLDGKTAAPVETDPVKLAKKTIDEFKAEQKQKEEVAARELKTKQEADQKVKEDELAAAWEVYNKEVEDFIIANKDEYELINTYNQQALIAETVDEFYNRNKRVLSVKDAADLVEQYLEDEAKKALSTKKFAKQEAQPSAKPKEEAKPVKTLTNQMQPTSASVLPAASEADRMKRAMAALESNKR